MTATSRHAAWRSIAVVVMLVLSNPIGARQSPSRAAAWQVLDIASGRLVSSDDERIARPVLPGSVLKVAALVAALESGAISPSTRVTCPGFVDVGGRRIACLHPRVRRPLTAAEALSYSCNTFFAAVGTRLSRDRLNAAFETLGLPRVPRKASVALAAMGVESAPVSPAALLQAFTRLVTGTDGLAMRGTTRSVVVEGLRGAAVFGTASGLAARGLDALATTGGAEIAGSREDRVVLVAWPAARPVRAAVVVAERDTTTAAVDDAAAVVRAGTTDRAAATDRAAGTRAPAALEPSPSSPVAAASSLSLRVGFAGPGGYRVETLDLEEYVARVLAGEAATRSAPAALEALAITIRTFALANRNRHGGGGFDLCDETHCQVLRAPYPAARAAAAATAGLVLASNGAPASVYYTASCGGMTERPSNVWPGAVDPPFMPIARDTACDDEPPWSVEIATADLQRALAAGGFRGTRLRDLRVASRSESGRVMTLQIDGLSPGDISGQRLRMTVGRTLGWRLLKSTAFDVRRTSRGYRFSGRGFGHGVGFCVIGAARRAAGGATRARLLDQYFPGLAVARVTADMLRAPVLSPPDPEVPLDSGDASTADVPVSRRATPAPPPPTASVPSPPPSPVLRPAPQAASVPRTARGVGLVLPSADERDRPYLEAMIDRALAGAAARIGRSAPGRVDVVFHVSAEAFAQTTGEPLWSEGVTRGTRIDLQPVQILRDRGALDEAVRHEAAHVVTGAALAGRATWVREGAAFFAAGTLREADIARAGRERERPPCPSDAEFERSAPQAVYDAAAARARMCFARALASGLRWDEVR